MQFMPGMAVNGIPPVPFHPLAQVPLVANGAPRVTPPIPPVPYAGPRMRLGCASCQRGGMAGTSGLSTRAKVAILGLIGLGAAVSAVVIHRRR